MRSRRQEQLLAVPRGEVRIGGGAIGTIGDVNAYRMRTALQQRRGASFLELLASMVSLVLLLFGLYVVGSLYWSATVISTSADVAAQSSQSAYDRWRFGSTAFNGDATADAANHAVALQKAREAGQIVLGSVLTQGSGGGLVGIDTANREPGCGSSAPGGLRSDINVETGIGPGGQLNRVTVDLSAQWSAGLTLLSGGGMKHCLRTVARSSSLRGE